MPRPGLISQLDTAIAQGQKLILIAAPAGFGKTTMVAEWLRGSKGSSAAWLALDDTDNHLNRFLAYLIATLEAVRPTISTAAWTLLRSHTASPPTHAILSALVNTLAASADPLLLILDDYHTITLQTIHEAIVFLRF